MICIQIFYCQFDSTYLILIDVSNTKLFITFLHSMIKKTRFLFTTERYRLFLASVSVRSPETALGVLQNRGSTMQPAIKSTKLQFIGYNLPLNSVIVTSERGLMQCCGSGPLGCISLFRGRFSLK